MPFANDSVLPFGAGTIALVGDQGGVLGVGHVGLEDPGSGLVQRWVLYPEYQGPPYQVITFQPAQRQYGSLGEWYEDLTSGSLWKPGSQYVKATVDFREQLIWGPLVVVYQANEVVGYVCVYSPQTMATAPDLTPTTRPETTAAAPNRTAAALVVAAEAPSGFGPRSEDNCLFTIERWTVFDSYVPPPAASFELRPPGPGQDANTLHALSASRPSWDVTVNCYTYSALPTGR